MPPVLQELGWTWGDDGVVFRVVVDGVVWRVRVPLHTVNLVFGRELAAVGCPDMVGGCVRIGEPVTVVGLFGGITRALSRGFRKATRAVRKGAGKVVRAARKVVRSPIVKWGVTAAAAAVPALAPAAVALHTADRALRTYDQGRAAAEQFVRGNRSRAVVRAMRQAAGVQRQIARAIPRAQRGDVRARQLMGALQQMRSRRPMRLPAQMPRAFRFW
jgi:hypothetical protein